MSALPTPADNDFVEREAATLQLQTSDRKKALRALKDMGKATEGIDCSETNVKRWVAAKRLITSRYGPKANVTAAMMKSFHKTVDKANTYQVAFWVVQKKQRPNLLQDSGCQRKHRMFSFHL